MKSNLITKKLAEPIEQLEITIKVLYIIQIQSFIRSRKICFFISSKINFTSTKKKERGEREKKGV